MSTRHVTSIGSKGWDRELFAGSGFPQVPSRKLNCSKIESALYLAIVQGTIKREAGKGKDTATGMGRGKQVRLQGNTE